MGAYFFGLAEEGMARRLADYVPEAGDELARRTLVLFFAALRLLLEGA